MWRKYTEESTFIFTILRERVVQGGHVYVLSKPKILRILILVQSKAEANTKRFCTYKQVDKITHGWAVFLNLEN